MNKLNKFLSLLPIAAASIVCVGLAAGTSAIISSADEPTWWENNCELPDGYTSIGNILDFGTKSDTYKTRGTVTYIEDTSFFIQSQNRGIYIYSSSAFSEIGVGKVVDIEGTYTVYNGLPELTNATVNVIADSNPYPVERYEFKASEYELKGAESNCRLVKVTGLTFSSAKYSTYRATLKFNDDTITTYLGCSNSLEVGHALEELANSYEGETFNFYGVIGFYKAEVQLRVNSIDCFELVENGESGEDTPPVVTGGTVVENPTQSGDVLGPLYIPEDGEMPTVSYQEMVGTYGDSIFIDYGNFEMLIDGGADEDTTHVMEYIASKCADHQLEVLILTHPHVDHFGGIDNYSDWVNTAGIQNIKYIIH